MSSSPLGRSEEDHISWRTDSGVVFRHCHDASGLMELLDQHNAALYDNAIRKLRIEIERDERDHPWIRVDGGRSLVDHLRT